MDYASDFAGAKGFEDVSCHILNLKSRYKSALQGFRVSRFPDVVATPSMGWHAHQRARVRFNEHPPPPCVAAGDEQQSPLMLTVLRALSPLIGLLAEIALLRCPSAGWLHAALP